MPALPPDAAPDLPTARRLLYVAPEAPPYDLVVLTHADRAIRVRALTTVHDETFVVALETRQSLETCYGFELEDGRCIQIIHAEEPLVEVKGDITRMAWHIGALNLPCQIEADRLLLPYHAGVLTLLEQLGAQTRRVSEPFTPETPKHHGHSHP